MIHYAVTKGEYSDYRICRIFSDKSEAEKYIKLFSLEDVYSPCGIEEFPDDICPEPFLFQVCMNVQDSSAKIVFETSVLKEPEEQPSVESFLTSGEKVYRQGQCWAYGRTKEEATKICAEIWTHLRARMKGRA